MREGWITFLPFPPQSKKMAVAEKIVRSAAKRTLLRCRSALTNLIPRRAENSVLLEVMEALVECFADLEKAHNKYLAATEIDVALDENVEEADYLDQPQQEVTDALFNLGEFMKREEESKRTKEDQVKRLEIIKAKKSKGDLAILEECIARFGSPAENVSKLIA